MFLRAEAKAHEGKLSADEIENLTKAFLSKDEVLADFYETLADGCMESFAESRFTEIRRNLLGRLVVHTFGDRFVEHAADPSRGLSREILPGFFHALNLMAGGEAIETLQAASADIVADLRMKHGDSFSWPVYYEDARAKAILYRVLGIIAIQFLRFEQRRDWFCNIVTVHAEGDAAPHSVPSPISEEQFTMLMNDLFQSVRPESMSTERRAWMERLIGKDAVDAFDTMFSNLTKALKAA
ncbi:MAG: hypothetical protein OQK53_11000 [Rhodospirillales bacterium]|nr:hypothetical protein [Rhodospirillales bacterium]MCW8953218.1 hypothetical protein [Rhodospirillales bacterium]